jgi:hypothetical protein
MVGVRSRSRSLFAGLRTALSGAFLGGSAESGVLWVRELAVACALEGIRKGGHVRASREVIVWAYERRVRRWTEGKP